MLLFTENKSNPMYLALLSTGQFIDPNTVAPLSYDSNGYYARDKQLMKQYKKTIIIADFVYDSTLKLLRYTCAYNEFMKDFFLDEIAPRHKSTQSLIRAWNGYKNKCLLTTKLILKDESSYIIKDWADLNHLTQRPDSSRSQTVWDSELELYRKEQDRTSRLSNLFLQLDDLLKVAGVNIPARTFYFSYLDDPSFATHINEVMSTYDPRLGKWLDSYNPETIIREYALMKFNIKANLPIDPIVVGLDARLHAERVLGVPHEQLDKYNTFQGDAIEWDTVGHAAYFGRTWKQKEELIHAD